MKYILAFSLLLVATLTLAQAPAVPQASIVVSSLSQLTGYTGSLLQANWTDELRGGKFDLVDTAGLTVDNGIIFSSGKAGKVWKRDVAQSQAINAGWFNISSSTTDVKPVLQAMLDAGLKKIYFPKATYSFSSTVKPRDSLEIFGEKGTVFAAATGFVGTTLFQVDTVTSFTLRDVELKINYKTRFALISTAFAHDIKLSRVIVSKTKFHGMYLRGENVYMDYCTFDSCGIADSALYANSAGIFTSGVQNLNIDRCTFSNNRQHGIYSLGNDSGYTSITNCEAGSNGGSGLSIRTQAGRIIANHCFRNGARGLFLNNQIEVPPPVKSKYVACIGNIVEDNNGATDDVLISGANGLEFIGNVITSNGTSAFGLKINKCNSCDFSNNVINGGPSGVIAVFDTTNNMIIGNNHINGGGGSGILLYQSGAVPLMNVGQIQNNQFYGTLSVGINFQAASYYNDIILQGNLYKDVSNHNIFLDGHGTHVQNRDEPLQRIGVSVDYTISPDDRYIAITSTHDLDSITLPLANSVPAGTEIVVVDEGGNISNSFRPVTFLTQGSNLLNGAATKIITDPFAFLTFISNGIGSWTFRDRKQPTRIAKGNGDYTILPYQPYVALTSIFSFTKTFTLPAANSVPPGYELVIADESGSVTSSIKLTIAAAGSDLINGNATEDITTPYGVRRLISDGVSKWFFDGSIVRVNQTQTLTNKSLSGSSNTFTNIPLTTAVTGILPKANGGTGTATPGLTAGTNITITGTWPNNTITAASGGSSLGYSLPVTTTASQSPADGATLFPGPNSATVSAVTGANKIYIPKSGTITHVSFFASVVTITGTTETASLYVRVNNTTDYLVSSAITLSAATQEFHNNSLTIPVSGDYADYIEFKLVCPTWATNPTGVRMTIQAQVE